MVGARACPFARTSTMRARSESTKGRWQGRRRSGLFQSPTPRYQNTVSLGALGGLQSWRRGWPCPWLWQLMVFWPLSPPAATALYPRRRAIAHTGDGRAHLQSHNRLHLPAPCTNQTLPSIARGAQSPQPLLTLVLLQCLAERLGERSESFSPRALMSVANERCHSPPLGGTAQRRGAS